MQYKQEQKTDCSRALVEHHQDETQYLVMSLRIQAFINCMKACMDFATKYLN